MTVLDKDKVKVLIPDEKKIDQSWTCGNCESKNPWNTRECQACGAIRKWA